MSFLIIIRFCVKNGEQNSKSIPENAELVDLVLNEWIIGIILAFIGHPHSSPGSRLLVMDLSLHQMMNQIKVFLVRLHYYPSTCSEIDKVIKQNQFPLHD